MANGAFIPSVLPTIVGHRGAPTEAKENTHAAVCLAVDAGASWVELDARLCCDGGVVASHDPVTEMGTVVSASTLEALKDEGLEPLSDVIAAGSEHFGINLEIKADPTEPTFDETFGVVDAVVPLLTSYPGPVIVSSFNPLALVRLTEVAPSLPRALLTYGVPLEVGIDSAVELDCVGLFPHDETEGLDQQGVRAVHGEELQIMVWTVDDETRLEELSSWSVDAVCTNTPRKFVMAQRPTE